RRGPPATRWRRVPTTPRSSPRPGCPPMDGPSLTTLLRRRGGELRADLGTVLVEQRSGAPQPEATAHAPGRTDVLQGAGLRVVAADEHAALAVVWVGENLGDVQQRGERDPGRLAGLHDLLLGARREPRLD